MLQLWCAAGVNLSGGKTRDGGLIVGASVFYSDVPGPQSPKKKIGSQSSLDKLDQELKVYIQESHHSGKTESIKFQSFDFSKRKSIATKTHIQKHNSFTLTS